ncbi:MAG: hypothetical protein HYX27_02005 [Acidobacteria bacterium]|nr:hypothetical protein [Acidobacteriota bacterium]
MKLRWLAGVFLAAAAWAQAPAGRWDGTITYGKLKVPFTMHFAGSGKELSGTLVNGEVRVSSSSGSFAGGEVALTFAGGVRMAAKLENGELKGTLGAQVISAAAYCTCGLEGTAGPEIMGAWNAGELGRIVVTRKGEDTFAMLTRAGDTLGPLNGRFDGLSFLLHYFDGTRAAVLELEPMRDGPMDATLSEPGKEAKKAKAARAN